MNSVLVGQAVTRSSLEREVWDSNLGPIKSDTVLPTARHRCDISSKGAVLPGRNDAEIGPVNLLHVHASAYYIERNERFNLKMNRLLLLRVLHLCDLEKLKISLLEFFVTKMQLGLTTICVYFITVLLSASFTLCRYLQQKNYLKKFLDDP